MRQQRPHQSLLKAAALLLLCALATTAAISSQPAWARVLLLIVSAAALLAALMSAWPAVYAALRRAEPQAPAVLHRRAKSSAFPAGRARRRLPGVLPDLLSAVAAGEMPEGEGDATAGTTALQTAAALEGDFSCIAQARDLVADFLSRVRADHGLPVSARAMDVAQLVVSELVTNARKYAPGPALLELRVAGGRLEVTVWDSDPSLPLARAAEPGRVGQHGLEIVMAVAQSFEAHREPVGKRVTAAIALSDDTDAEPAIRRNRTAR
jgi:anti-sigma regulatory factor (Ser/Thr protein kinase)